jgi:hypothetical protein
MFTRSAPRALLLTAMLVMAIGACGAPGAQGGPSSSAAASPAALTTPAAPAPTPAAPAPTPAAPAPTPAAAGSPFTGYVQQVDSTGDFILASGAVSYTVVMSPTTAVVNLRGRAITRLFIRVSGSVQVTGTLAGSKISAQSVLVPTTKDIPDG